MSHFKFIVCAALLCCGSTAFAQSANDLCANAIALPEGTATAFDTTLDSPDGVNPGCGGGTAPTDIWFTLTPSISGVATVSTCGSSYDTRLAAYDSCVGVLIACNDDSCGLQSNLTFAVTMGVPVTLQVGGFNAATGSGTVVWNVVPPATNDDCANALVIGLGDTAVNTTSATTDGPGIIVANCSQWAGDTLVHNDVWFEHTATFTGTLRASTCNQVTFDSKLAAYEATCPAAAGDEIACNDDGAGCTGFSSIMDFAVTTGNTYLIEVGGFTPTTSGVGTLTLQAVGSPVSNVQCAFDGGTDTVTVTWDEPGSAMGGDTYNVYSDQSGVQALEGSVTSPTASFSFTVPNGFVGIVTCCVEAVSGVLVSDQICCTINIGGPPNDNCIDAIVVGLGTTPIDNTLGSPDGATSCGVITNVWYEFTPATSGGYAIDTCGSLFDTELAIFPDNGVCPPPIGDQIVCSSQGVGTTPCTPQSGVDIPLMGGQTYLISIDGFAGSQGSGVLNIAQSAEPVSNVVCMEDVGLDTITVGWTLPASGMAGDTYNVYSDQTGIQLLEGSVTNPTNTFTFSFPNGFTGLITVCVEAVTGIGTSQQVCCQVGIGGPANDNCADAIPALLGSNAFDTTLATTDHTWTCAIGGSEIWYTFNAPATGQYVMSLCGSAYDTAISVFDGIACPAAGQIVCNDDSCGLQSQVIVSLTGGNDYLIAVGGFNGGTGTGNLEITQLIAPSNDTCAGALAIGLGATPFDLTGAATDSAVQTLCAFPFGDQQVHNDVYYTFTANVTNQHLLSTCGSPTDTRIVIYNDATCPDVAANALACNDDSCGLQSEILVNLTMGNSYLVVVGGFSATSTGVGTLNISVDCGDLGAPICTYDCTTNEVTVSWTDNANATSYTVSENGIDVSGPLPAGTSSYTVTAPAAGTNTYTIDAPCSLGGTITGSCSVTVQAPPGPGTDLILQLEGLNDAGNPGLVDSGAALAAALTNAGRTPVIFGTPDFDQYACLTLGDYETVWVLSGTFGNEYEISTAEGDFLAAYLQNNLGNLYLEGGDYWGFFANPSMLEGFDGIDFGPSTDGDDSLLVIDGANAPLAGLDLSANLGVVYTQDQGGNDWTDQLVLADLTTVDPMVTSAEVIFTQAGGAYNVGVIAVHSNGSIMISSSFEFGGYGAAPDQDALAVEYLGVLKTLMPMDQFIRGDANIDGGVNIADAVYILGNLFPGMNPPNVLNCADAADCNDDGGINIADAVACLGSLFGAPTTPLPLPNAGSGCGSDPTTGDSLNCASHPCP